jgi:L-threonylcarbamoyladenylate synthase
MKSFKEIIKNGGVAVIKIDTLYGLVCDAFNQHAVNRIYALKKRNPLKPVIVLIASLEDIKKFGINLDKSLSDKLARIWPAKISVIVSSNDISVNTHYIHKGTGGIAF